MKLIRFLVEQDYQGNYNVPPKFVATASFSGPFGNLSVKLSELLLADIVGLLAVEAARVARTNAQEIGNACVEAADSLLALTHEAEATS